MLKLKILTVCHVVHLCWLCLLACEGSEDRPFVGCWAAGRRHTVARHRQGQVPKEVELWRVRELETWSVCRRVATDRRISPRTDRTAAGSHGQVDEFPSGLQAIDSLLKNEQGMRGSATFDKEGTGTLLQIISSQMPHHRRFISNRR